MNTRIKLATLALAGLFAAAAQATTLDKLTVTPATGAKAGEKIKVTIDLANVSGMCGMFVKLGDGRKEMITVEESTPNPIVIEHTYKTGGKYRIRADGDRIKMALPCSGRVELDNYMVEAVKVAVKDKADGGCPDNWTLKGKVAKDGGFTCVPKKGVKDVKKPEKAMECPAGTSYFTKGKTLGCEKD